MRPRKDPLSVKERGDARYARVVRKREIEQQRLLAVELGITTAALAKLAAMSATPKCQKAS